MESDGAGGGGGGGGGDGGGRQPRGRAECCGLVGACTVRARLARRRLAGDAGEVCCRWCTVGPQVDASHLESAWLMCLGWLFWTRA